MKIKLALGGVILITIIMVILNSSSFTPSNTVSANKSLNEIKLPTYPSLIERHPEMLKSKTLSEFKSESSSAQEITIEEDTPVNFKGFVGKYYSKKINNVIKILDNTVTIHNKSGNWSSLGLIRNETNGNLDSASIIAVLKDNEGNILDEIENTILVEGIRPGEPAPFSITTTIPFENVSDVEWKVKKIQSPPKNRDFITYVNWELPFGTDTYGFTKREDAPYPYVIFTSFENLGTDVTTAKIVIAWINEEGQVVWIEESNLDENSQNGVKKNSIGDFEKITVTDPAIGPMLSELEYIMWVVGE